MTMPISYPGMCIPFNDNLEERDLLEEFSGNEQNEWLNTDELGNRTLVPYQCAGLFSVSPIILLGNTVSIGFNVWNYFSD